MTLTAILLGLASAFLFLFCAHRDRGPLLLVLTYLFVASAAVNHLHLWLPFVITVGAVVLLSGVFAAVQGAREGLKMPNRSHAYDKQISDAQQTVAEDEADYTSYFASLRRDPADVHELVDALDTEERENAAAHEAMADDPETGESGRHHLRD